MRVGLKDHLVTRAQGQAGGDGGVGLGGVADEGDLGWIRAEETGHIRSRGGELRVAVLSLGLQAAGDLGDALEHRGRGRAESAGVEVAEARFQRIEGAHRLPKRLRLLGGELRERLGSAREAEAGGPKGSVAEEGAAGQAHTRRNSSRWSSRRSPPAGRVTGASA